MAGPRHVKSDIAKPNKRVGVKLDVVIVSPPVSCSTCYVCVCDEKFVRMRRCAVIGEAVIGVKDGE